MRGRRPILLGLVVAAALALAAPVLADPPVTTTDTGGIQVQTAQPVVAQVAGAHIVRRARKKHAAPPKPSAGHVVVPAATVATLPFTGAHTGTVAALGLALLGAGTLLRRAAPARVSRR